MYFHVANKCSTHNDKSLNVHQTHSSTSSLSSTWNPLVASVSLILFGNFCHYWILQTWEVLNLYHDIPLHLLLPDVDGQQPGVV